MNQRRTPPPPPPKPKREFSFFNWLNRFLPLEKFFGEKDERHQDRVPIRYFYYFLWVVFLLVAYERVVYISEQYVRKSIRLKKEVEDLRAEYTVTKADYMKSGKQSEIVERVRSMGLEENLTPPKKIVSLAEERE